MSRKKKSDPHATRWGKFLQAAIKMNSSDLIMKSDQVPKLRLRGALKPLDCEPVSAEEFWGIAEAILDKEQQEDLHKFGSVDFAYDYDGVWAILLVGAIAAMRAAGHQPLITTWDDRYWLAFPLVVHFQILCNVWVHNASHGNFPRPINRLVGELAGLVALTRFASWEVIHQRHHRYSDDLERDPHPVMASYWRYVLFTITNVEKQLQQTYFDHYGDTPAARRSEKARAVLSFATGVLLIAAWYTLLGPQVFVRFFVPGTVIAILHLIHFNWSTHNAFSPSKDYRPINLDSGFYRVGNVLWHGIYWHANHHKRAGLFNPGTMPNGEAITIPGT